MKRTVVFSLACAAGLLFGLSAQAQDATPTPAASCPSCSGTTSSTCPDSAAGHRKHGEHGDVLKHLSATLGLSGTQEAAIAPILQGAAPQMKAITDEAMAKRKALIESVSSQITPILTPDQQTKFAALVQKFESGRGLAMRRHFGHRGDSEADSPSASADASTSAGQSGPGGHGPDAAIQHLTQALDLTSDQQAQITPILANQRQQVKAVHEDSTLSPQDKMAKIQSIRADSANKIEALLNDTQKQKFAQDQQRRQQHMQAPAA